MIAGLLVLTINTSFAGLGGPEVDDTFNYQGELFDGLDPANGSHDFTIEAWSLPDAGTGSLIGQMATFLNVTVTNGVFTLENIDLGDITDGFNIYYEIQVRKNNVGAAYEVLSPRQKMKSVPYATTLTSGDAQLSQVLTYDGREWGAQFPIFPPWNQGIGNDAFILSGKVGIGIDTPTASLHVKTTDIIPVVIDGGANATTIFSEEGRLRGFVGSGGNIAVEDFSIGSLGGDMHIISGASPRLSVTNTGEVGINTTTPFADLHIEGTTGGDLFRVRIDSITKLRVHENGGTGIGTFTNPPVNGLIVAGDGKQTITSDGMMKYMVSVNNCGNANVSIAKSYNGVDSGVITPQNDAGDIGTCEVLFTNDILTLRNNTSHQELKKFSYQGIACN